MGFCGARGGLISAWGAAGRCMYNERETMNIHMMSTLFPRVSPSTNSFFTSSLYGNGL